MDCREIQQGAEAAHTHLNQGMVIILEKEDIISIIRVLKCR